MDLTPDTEIAVTEALRELLTTYAEAGLVGVTCLARGSDQIFARVVLELGGQLEVVLPSSTYREQKVKPENRTSFDALFDQATHVHTMPFIEANREAYEAANKALLDTVDRLAAVWDGHPGNGKGGTADTVQQARELGKTVDVVWPDGAQRAR